MTAICPEVIEDLDFVPTEPCEAPWKHEDEELPIAEELWLHHGHVWALCHPCGENVRGVIADEPSQVRCRRCGERFLSSEGRFLGKIQ